MVLSDIRKSAREALKGKWGKAILIFLTYMAFEFVIGFVSGLFESLETILSIATTVISVPLAYGLIYCFMKLQKGEDVKCYDFFKLGFSNFARSWKIIGNILLKMWLPILLYVLAIIALVVIITFGVVASATSETSAFAIIGLIIGSILVAASFVYLFIQSLNYAIVNFVAIDNEQMSAKDVVNESKKLMKGYKWKYILLNLSFAGWIVLSVFTLYIGMLWVLPYLQVAQICFYAAIKDKKVEE